MVDLLEVEHLVDSLSSAVDRLDSSLSSGDAEESSRLRTLIFDLQQNLDRLTKI